MDQFGRAAGALIHRWVPPPSAVSSPSEAPGPCGAAGVETLLSRPCASSVSPLSRGLSGQVLLALHCAVVTDGLVDVIWGLRMWKPQTHRHFQGQLPGL